MRSISWRKLCWCRSTPWSRPRRSSTSYGSRPRRCSSSPPTPPASWAACWVTGILRRPRLHRPPPPGYGARPMPALCPALEPGAVVWTAASGARRWLELSAYRRDHGGWCCGRGAGLSGGRIFTRWALVIRPVSAAVADSLAAAEGRPEETVINNYYDDSGREHGRVDNTSLGDSGSDAANLQQASDDLQGRRG